MTDKEKFYDEEIAPKLLELANACDDKGLSFVAGVSYGNCTDEVGITRIVKEDSANLSIVALAFLAHATPNIDQFLTSLIKYCERKNISIGSSIFLSYCDSFMKGLKT